MRALSTCIRPPDQPRTLSAAWLILARCVGAAEHDHEHGSTPKMPGKPKRVQLSRDRNFKKDNWPNRDGAT
jgi:hypothetical protein